MSAEDDARLAERYRDQRLSAEERAQLARRLREDALFAADFIAHLRLALVVGEALDDDPVAREQRAELLMATLSGTRRMAVWRGIEAQIGLSAPPLRRGWPTMVWKLAVAATLVIATGWWLQRSPGPPPSPAPPLAFSPPPVVKPAHDVAARAPSLTPGLTPPPHEQLNAPLVPEPASARAAPSPSVVVTADEPASQAAPAAAPPAVGAASPPAPAMRATTADAVEPKAARGSLTAVGGGILHRLGAARQDLSQALGAAGTALRVGDVLCVPVDASPTLSLGDTRVETAELTRLVVLPARAGSSGPRRLALDYGTLTLAIDPAAPLALVTPHAELSSDDAEATISVYPGWTHVEVRAGSVRVRTAVDGKAIEAGRWAVMIKGRPTQVAPLAQPVTALIAGGLTRRGVPWLPLVWLRASAVAEHDASERARWLAAVVEGGGNAVISVADGELLDAAADGDLAVFAVVDPAAATAHGTVARLHDHPALAGWWLGGDDPAPAGRGVSAPGRAALALRRIDATCLLFASEVATGRAQTWADGWSARPRLADDAWPALVHAAGARPCLGTVEVPPGNSDEAAGLLRLRAYRLLVAGARGLVWSSPDAERAQPALREVADELRRLAPVFAVGVRSPLMTGDAGLLAARWDYADRVVVVVVNASTTASGFSVPVGEVIAVRAFPDGLAPRLAAGALVGALPAGEVGLFIGERPFKP